MITKLGRITYINSDEFLDWLYNKCKTEQEISDAYRNKYIRTLMGFIDNNDVVLLEKQCVTHGIMAHMYEEIYSMIEKEIVKCTST